LATTLGNEEGSDIWGWTDPMDGKEYAIFGATNSTAFVDVTDPVNPIFLGRIETANGNTSFWRDIKVYNNHAYIVADIVGNHGMQVFDLTILRNGVDPDLSGGPIFIDISNPNAPTVSGRFPDEGYTHDAQVITYNGPDATYVGQEILAASNGGSNDRIVFLDVTDKANPQFISEINYPNPGYAHQGWFTEDHQYFIFGDEQDEQNFGSNTKTFVFDVTDLDNPSLNYTYTGPTAAIDHNGYVKGDEFFLANYRAGVRILDITNIASTTNAMTEIGYFDTYPSSNGTAFNGVWSIYPYFASGNIIVSDIERGLFVLRASNNPLSTANFELATAFSLSPNPAKADVTIKATENKMIKSLEVYNILGKKLFSKDNINTESFVLPIQNLSNGIYLVKINDSTSKKLIVNK